MPDKDNSLKAALEALSKIDLDKLPRLNEAARKFAESLKPTEGMRRFAETLKPTEQLREFVRQQQQPQAEPPSQKQLKKSTKRAKEIPHLEDALKDLDTARAANPNLRKSEPAAWHVIHSLQKRKVVIDGRQLQTVKRRIHDHDAAK